jgi:hypothetical protein
MISRTGIIKRPMPHWDLWIWYRFNVDNSIRLLDEYNNQNLVKLIHYLQQIAFQKGMIPHRLFRKGNSVRVSSLCKNRSYEVEVGESRFINYTTTPKGKLSNHNKVLIPILEKEGNSLAIETPLWCIKLWFEGKWITVTGHVDLIQYIHPYIYIWDYKPDKAKTVGDQVMMYKYMLTQLVGVDYEKIKVGWFDNSMEYIVKDTKIFPFNFG